MARKKSAGGAAQPARANGAANGAVRPSLRAPAGVAETAKPEAKPAARSAKAAKTAKSAGAVAPAVQPLLEAPVRIFQIYFEPWQRELLAPEFIPLDNGGEPGEYLEFGLFERLSISEHVKGASLWGALSWRFTEKTGVSGAELRALIDANPGYDVYYCNPYPHLEATYHNLWLHGETVHPRFAELARAFLQAAELPDETRDIVPSGLYSTANYFVGSPKFWAAYLPFVRGAIARADRNLPPAIAKTIHAPMPDERGLYPAGTTYMPFLVERLFSSFMRSAGSTLKGFKLPLTLGEEEINVHLKLLREMKDTAWRTKSLWLAACWVNYRNLYLQQQFGAEWTRKHLRSVTPSEIRFA